MEKALGIRVVRHITKKPAGDAADLEKHFRCFRSPCHQSSLAHLRERNGQDKHEGSGLHVTTFA